MQIDSAKKFFHPPESVKRLSKVRRTQSEISQKSTPPNTKLLPQIDIFNLKGFQCGYSIADAAASLWQRKNTRVRRDDPPSVARFQARLRRGNLRMTPLKKRSKTI